jgi:hypothetical protein
MLVGILPKFYKRAAKKVSVSEANLSTRRDLACTTAYGLSCSTENELFAHPRQTLLRFQELMQRRLLGSRAFVELSLNKPSFFSSG